jgi:HSP20 family protein
MQSSNWGLALDVVENKDEFIVKASIPGIKPEDIDVSYSDGVLSIQGEMKSENEKEEEQYHLRERRYGTFSRSISLPSHIKGDQIEANYENGVLMLHLPKAEEMKPKRIPIKVGDGHQKMIEGKMKK